MIIHMGAPKTGTTAFQHYCTNNEADFLRQGAYYLNGFKDRNGLGHHELIKDVRNDPSSAAERVIFEVDQKEIAMRKSFDVIIISSEGFINLIEPIDDRRNFHIFLDTLSINFEITLVVTLRPLPAFLRSLYLQNMIDGNLSSPLKYYEHAVNTLQIIFETIDSEQWLRSKVAFLLYHDNINSEILDFAGIQHDGSNIVKGFYGTLDIHVSFFILLHRLTGKAINDDFAFLYQNHPRINNKIRNFYEKIEKKDSFYIHSTYSAYSDMLRECGSFILFSKNYCSRINGIFSEQNYENLISFLSRYRQIEEICGDVGPLFTLHNNYMIALESEIQEDFRKEWMSLHEDPDDVKS